MKNGKYFVLLALLLGLLLPTSCLAGSQNHDNANSDLPEVSPVGLHAGQKLAVVATTSIIGDVVSNVGGELIDLTVLIGIGQNPHSFEPTPQDLAAVESADIVFINGEDLEEVLVDAIEEIATGVVVTVSAGIELLPFGDPDHEHAAGDPHFWVDPNNVIVWVENILQVLSEADPADAVGYHEQAAGYLADLKALDVYIREQTAQIPEEDRKIVTDHYSLGYFAEEYGYRIIGAVIPSTSDTGGASAGEVAELAGLMKQEDVRVIFIGETAGQGMQSLAEALAGEIGGEVRIVTLLSGSLAPEGEPGETYLEYVRYNTDQIVSGLVERNNQP